MSRYALYIALKHPLDETGVQQIEMKIWIFIFLSIKSFYVWVKHDRKRLFVGKRVVHQYMTKLLSTS